MVAVDSVTNLDDDFDRPRSSRALKWDGIDLGLFDAWYVSTMSGIYKHASFRRSATRSSIATAYTTTDPDVIDELVAAWQAGRMEASTYIYRHLMERLDLSKNPSLLGKITDDFANLDGRLPCFV